MIKKKTQCDHNDTIHLLCYLPSYQYADRLQQNTEQKCEFHYYGNQNFQQSMNTSYVPKNVKVSGMRMKKFQKVRIPITVGNLPPHYNVAKLRHAESQKFSSLKSAVLNGFLNCK